MSKQVNLTSCQNITIMPPNWLGDVVMAQPALAALCQTHCHANINIVGRPWLRELLPFLNLGTHVRYAKATTCKQDATIIFPNSFRSAWQAFRSGSPIRIGFKKEARSIFLTHAYKPKVDVMTQHHRDYFIDLAEQMGTSVIQQNVYLTYSKEAQEKGRALMASHGLNPDKVVCIAPGAHFGGAKRYSAESYAYILYWLAKKGWQPLILGSKNEKSVGTKCLSHIKALPYWNSAGETSLEQALQLVSACQLMLCNDSGLMHVAAGMNKPTVGIFGATLPDRTSPSGSTTRILYQPAPCSPCLKRECSVAGHPCMTNVLPETVYNTCLDILTP